MNAPERCAVMAGLYARVSTDEQTVANQLADLRRLCEARGWAPVLYEEQESAVKVRPVLDRLLADARAGRIRAVVVWALDRLHRSMKGTIDTILELDRLGVPVVSVRESWLDTSGPVRSLLVAIFGWMAEQERARLIERTVTSIERVKREESTEHGRAARRLAGKRAIGRPRVPVTGDQLSSARAQLAAGLSVRQAARAVGLSRDVLRRALAQENGAKPS